VVVLSYQTEVDFFGRRPWGRSPRPPAGVISSTNGGWTTTTCGRSTAYMGDVCVTRV
jgi:hypothetical protein